MMIKNDLIELHKVFLLLAKSGTTKFKYAVLKNIGMLKSSIEIFKDIEKEIKDVLNDFESDRAELIKRLGTPDNSGNIAVDLEDKETAKKFHDEYTGLLEKHKESLEQYQTKIMDYNLFLNEELTDSFLFNKLNINDFPTEGLSLENIEILEKFDIIDE